MRTPVVSASPDHIVRSVGRGTADLAEAARRLSLLAGLAHPGVCVPDQIGLTPAGDVVATMRRVPGESAAALARIRGGLPAAECAAIGVDVASALAAMHERGLAHGDVSPGNIVVGERGAVLVDVIAGARTIERGTPATAAPERSTGATAEADVYSLGATLRLLARDEERSTVRAWTEALCDGEPRKRPTARAAALGIRDREAPVSVEVPALDVARAIRARAIPPQARAGGPSDGTVKLARGRAWRAFRLTVRVAKIGSVASASLLLAVGMAKIVDAALPENAPIYRPTIPMPAHAIPAPPGVAAATLVEGRIAALASADGEALLAISREGSAAREADEATAARLTAGDLRYGGIEIEIVGVEVLSAVGNRATVRVTQRLSGHVVFDGAARTEVPQRTSVGDLDIEWGEEGWQVERSRFRGASATG